MNINMLNKLDTMLELIYRNLCISQTTCRGCRARNELEYAPEYKSNGSCLISKMCVFDLIGSDMLCKDCYCVDKDTMICRLLITDYNGNTCIKDLKYYGYWRVLI